MVFCGTERCVCVLVQLIIKRSEIPVQLIDFSGTTEKLLDLV